MIALALALLGAIALYAVMKYRRTAKDATAWPLAIAASLMIIGSEIKSYGDATPYKETGLWGIQLGATASQVTFIKGPATEEPIPKHLVFRLKDTGSVQRKQDAWDQAGGGTYTVILEDGRVYAILYNGSELLSPSIQGIRLHGSVEQLIEKFGQPSYVLESSFEKGHWYCFGDYNVAFRVQQNQIVDFAVYDSLPGPVAFD